MSRLQITDLNFCESASNTQVQGGLFLQPIFGLDLFRTLTFSIPGFEKYSSQETEKEVVEEFREPTSNAYGYQVTSKDGKKQSALVTMSKGNMSFSRLSSSSIS
jgi:hypothetical protein